MYLSLTNLAKKYDLHQDTIRKKIEDLVEGTHYIKINKIYRFNEKEMHNYLTLSSLTNHKNKDIELILNNILIQE